MRRKLLATLLLLWCFSLQVNAQTRIVKGKVVNEADGTGIPGASVLVTGTRTSTQTDQSGNYTIAVTGSDAKSLRITYVGFVAKVVPITGSTINISLKEDSEALDEIVVTGYGTQRKADNVGSTSSATAAERAARRTPSSRPSNAAV